MTARAFSPRKTAAPSRNVTALFRVTDLHPNAAVFLSYASQDAEVAKAICAALRAAGVNVWFDLNELRGGDTWDAKIRRQIKECTLFIPLISANTDARAEGYFRLEWKLAVDRSHQMSDDHSFLFPIVIDATPDATARVPDRFRDVQWTRLGASNTAETIAARVVRLLASETTAPFDFGKRSAPPARPAPTPAPSLAAPARHPSRARPIAIAAGAVVAVAIFLFWHASRPAAADAKPALPAAGTTQTSGAAPAASAGRATPAPLSEARQLIARAHAMTLEKYNSTAADYETAEGLIKQAIEKDGNDAEVWAMSSLFNDGIRARGFDINPARREAARTQAERALALDQNSTEALYALGRWQRDNESDPAIAERTFQRVLDKVPNHPGALGSLASVYHRTGRFQEAIELDQKAAAVDPKFRPLAGYVIFLSYFGRSHFEEAERTVRDSIAIQPSANSVTGLAMLQLSRYGDTAGAVRTLTTVPDVNRNEHRVIWMTAFAQLTARQPEAALSTLQRMSADFVQDNWFVGPRDYWAGRAHLQAGRPEAARLAFEAGLAVAETRFKDNDRTALRVTHAEILAWLGRTNEALREAQMVAELEPHNSRGIVWIESRARIYAALGRVDETLPLLDVLLHPKPDEDRAWPLTPQLLRVDPLWDKIRDTPQVQALLASVPPAGTGGK